MTRPDDLLSPEYRAQLLLMHEQNPKWGGAGRIHVEGVKEFAAEIGAKSVLDYGCGRGLLTTEDVGLPVARYDPGMPEWSALPGPADLVVCTDVIEHSEPDKLDTMLDHLWKLARKGLYLKIACSESYEILPDGRNAHLTVHPIKWWMSRLQRMKFGYIRHLEKKGLWVWVVK